MAEADDLRRSPTKIVQVPMDVALVQELDAWATKLGCSRSDVIRAACRREVKRLDNDEADRAYQESYERFPEDPGMGIAGLAAMAQVLEPEDW